MTVWGVGQEKRQRQWRRRDGLKGYGWCWLIEFFGILRCTQDDSKNGQRQRQPQVLRLRCSQSAASNFAQDNKLFEWEEMMSNGKGAVLASGLWRPLCRL